MKTTTVTDAQIATLARRQHEIYRRLTEGTLPIERVLAGMQDLIEGKFGDLIIDCNAAPFVSDGWSVEEHRKGGQLTLDMGRIRLHLSENQKGDKYVGGQELRRELKDQPVLNANVLYYLLVAHPHLIPEDWKGKNVFFWGTIYRDSDARLCVRYLCWRGGEWRRCSHWLAYQWGVQSPAAVSAS